jgi:hypothetical protein
MNPTVEAAWIAAGATFVAVSGTVTVAVSAARNTRKTTESTIQAERKLRILERRADAYQDSLADLLARQAEREKKLYPLRMDKAGNVYSPGDIFPQYEADGWFDKQGRLLTYSSEEVRRVFDLSTEAHNDLGTIYRERQSLSDRATDLPANDHTAHMSMGVKLADLQDRMFSAWMKANATDNALIEAIRLELSADPPPRTPVRRWRTAFRFFSSDQAETHRCLPRT